MTIPGLPRASGGELTGCHRRARSACPRRQGGSRARSASRGARSDAVRRRRGREGARRAGGPLRRREGLGLRGRSRSRSRCRSRASTCSRRSSRDGGYDTVLFANSVLAADVAAGLAARLDAGLNWDLADVELQDGELVGKRPALQDSVHVDVGWTRDAAPRALPRRLVRRDAERRRRRAGGRRRLARATRRTRRRRALVGRGRRGVERALDRGRRRDRRRRPRARRARELHARRGARAGARRRGRRDPRGRRRRLVPVLGPDRPDREDRLAEALRRARHLRRDPAQGRHAELGHDRRDQQGPERADLRVQRPRRRRRRARDRPQADRARPRSGSHEHGPSQLPAAVLRGRLRRRADATPRTSGSRSAC